MYNVKLNLSTINYELGLQITDKIFHNQLCLHLIHELEGSLCDTPAFATSVEALVGNEEVTLYFCDECRRKMVEYLLDHGAHEPMKMRYKKLSSKTTSIFLIDGTTVTKEMEGEL